MPEPHALARDIRNTEAPMHDTTEVPQARSSDPLTSKLAAARVNPGVVRTLVLVY